MPRFAYFAAACVLFAQQPEKFVIRSTTKLVQVNVIAVDKKGVPVDDLKSTDFEVSENGKPQTLSFFGQLRSNTLVQKPVEAPPNLFSNILLRNGMPASVTMILLDGLNTEWADQARARKQVLRFLSTIRPEDRVALYSLGRGLRVIHDFTSDTSALIERLNKDLGENVGDLAASSILAPEANATNASRDPLTAALDDPLKPSVREAEFYTSNRIVNTLKAIEAVAGRVAGLPGRKSLIWVAGSFPLTIGFNEDYKFVEGMASSPDQRTYFNELERTVRLLNHSGVSVYPVDVRGLMGAAVLNAANAKAPPLRNEKMFTTSNLDAMIEIAARTGGRAFYNRNDIDGAVRSAAEDGRVTYMLGYYPTVEPDDRYHRIRVKVNRPGVEIRYRQGYVAYREDQAKPESVQEAITQAFWSPLDATGVALNARVDLNSSTNAFDVAVQIDVGNVSLDKQGDRWLGRVDVGFMQKDEAGKAYGTITDTLHLKLPESALAQLKDTGLILRRSLARQEKAKTLRIVARDAPSGLTGSITIPIKDVRPHTPSPQR